MAIRITANQISHIYHSAHNYTNATVSFISRNLNTLQDISIREKNYFILSVSNSKNYIYLKNLSQRLSQLWNRFREPDRTLAEEEAASFQSHLEAETILSSCPEDFRGMSRLKKETHSIDPKTLSFLYNGSDEPDPSSFCQGMEYIRQFFIGRFPDANLPLTLLPFKEALERKAAFPKELTPETAPAALFSAAQELVQRAQELNPKESLVHIGALPTRSSPSSSFLFDRLQEALHFDFRTLLDDESVKESLKNKIFEFLPKEEITSRYDSLCNRILEHTEPLNRLHPNLQKLFLSSLEEDLTELFSTLNKEASSQELFNGWREKKLQETIDKILLKQIKAIRQKLQKPLDTLADKIAEGASPEFLEIASDFGFCPKPQGAFWIEITFEEEGRYSLSLFSNDHAIHPYLPKGRHLPLVYHNITLDTLNSDFFIKLLSYQVDPYCTGVEHSLSDMTKWLNAQLGSDALDPPLRCTLYPDTAYLNHDALRWMRVYWHHKLNLDHKEFTELFDYRLMFDMLINVWPHIHQHPNILKEDKSLCSSIKQIDATLRLKAQQLYEQKQLTLSELKELSATLWEVNETLNSLFPKILSPNREAVSALIPPEMQPFIEQLLVQVGLTPSDQEQCKQFFTCLLGEEFGDIFDALFKEFNLNHPEFIPENPPPNDPHPLQQFYQYLSVLTRLRESIPERLSLLHLYRAYISISRALYFFGALHLQIKLLQALFAQHLPASLGIGFYPLALLTIFFGPYLLKKLFPKDVFDTIQALSGIGRDISNYVIERFVLLIMQTLLRRVFLTEEQVAEFRRYFDVIHASMLRRGELDFNIQLEKRAPVVEIEETPSPIRSIPQELPSLDRRPRPKESPLTRPNELLFQIRQIQKQVDQFERPARPEKLLYLNRQIRNFPIPDSFGTDVWSQAENPLALLESLDWLLSEFYYLQRGEKSLSDSLETITSLYSLYAIVDTLSRRLEWAHIPNKRANGVSLLYWLQYPGYTFSNPKTYQQFKQVATYFGIDLTKKYNADDLKAYEVNRLFQPLNKNGSRSEKVEIWESYFKGEEGDYYRSLLKDERIQKRLQLHGIEETTPEIEKIIYLFQDSPFRSLDFSTSMAYNVLIDSPEDDRCGILPRPFYFLRTIHYLAQSEISRSLEKGAPPTSFFDGVTINQEFDYQLPLIALIKNPFHRLTFQAFRTRKFVSNIPLSINLNPPTSESKQYDILTSQKSRASDVKITAIYGQWKKLNPLFFFSSKTRMINPLFPPKAPRLQSAIALDTPTHFTPNEQGSVSPLEVEEQRLLEMIETDPADQIVRTLSFFAQSKDYLSDPMFRFLLKAFIYQLPLIDAQLKERPAIAIDIGIYFSKMVEYFSQKEDWDTALYLTKLAEELLIVCEGVYPVAARHFPNMTHVVQNVIAPSYRSQPPPENEFVGHNSSPNLILAYHYLVASYIRLQPEKLSEREKKPIMHAIALLGYSLRPFIYSSFNPDIVQKSISVFYLWKPHILKAIQTDPLFRDELLSQLVIDAASGLDEPECLKDPSPWLGEFPFYQKGDLPPIHLKERLVEHQDSSQRTSFFRNALSRQHETKKRTKQAPPLTLDQAHYPSLTLLHWFQPPSDIQLIQDPKDPTRLNQIKFPRLSLTFTLKMHEGQLRAMDSNNYWISPTQHHPALLQYGQYLLVENGAGDKKVYLAAQPYRTLLLLHFVKNGATLPTSAWLESYIPPDDHTLPELLTYSLKEGSLKSSDPEAIAYLSFFHYVHGNFSKSDHYFEELKEFGRLHPFTEKTKEFLSWFWIPLFLTNDPKSERTFLELAAIQESNHVFHQTSTRSSRDIPHYIALQVKYKEYLSNLETGSHPYLSKEDELLILHSIIRTSKDLFSSNFLRNSGASELITLCEYLGIDAVASHIFMLPQIAARYHELKKLYSTDSSWSFYAQKLLLNAFFPESKTDLPEEKSEEEPPTFVQSRSVITKIVSTYKEIANHPLSLNAFPDKICFDHLFYRASNIETLSLKLQDVTGDYLTAHFFSFYRLVLNDCPENIDSDLFEEKAAAVHTVLASLQGRYLVPHEAVLYGILLTIYPSVFSTFPSADMLENATPEDLQKHIQNLYKQAKVIATSSSIVRFGANELIEFAQKKLLKALQDTLKQPKFSKEQLVKLACEVVGGKDGEAMYYTGSIVARTGKSVWDTYQKLQKQLQANRIQDVHALSSMPNIEGDRLQAMQREEEAITHTMKALLHLHFDIETKEIAKPSPRTLSQQEEDLGIQQEFSNMNQSLSDYYARGMPLEKIYRLKEDPSDALSLIQHEVLQELKIAREKIEAFANQRADTLLGEEERVLAYLSNKEDSRRHLSFSEIDTAFIQEDALFFDHLTELTPEKKKELETDLYLYHIKASRWNCFFSQIQNRDRIGPELDRERVYRFDTLAEKIVRGKLAFESRMGKLLWDKQSSQFDRMLQSADAHLVLELIMGSGKSFYGIPQSDYVQADGNNLVINIWPSPLLHNNISTASRQAKTVYGQNAYALNIARSSDWSFDQTYRMKILFEKIRAQKEQFNFSKEQLQALELSFLEQMFDLLSTRSSQRSNSTMESIDSLRHILRLIRKSGIGHIDEAHAAYNPHKELNFPLGASKQLPIKYVQIIEETLFELIDADEFQSILTIRADAPARLPKERFEAEIAPILAEKMVNSPILNIPQADREECALYLRGKAKTLPAFLNDKNREQIALVKGLITVLLPSALNQIIHVNFNASKKGIQEQARPSEGNDNPLEESLIRSPFETFVKTGLLLARNRLNTKQCDKLIEKLQQRAKVRIFGKSSPENISIEMKNKLNRTPEARWFREASPKHLLFGFEPKDLPKIHANLRKSNRMVLRYLTLQMANEIRYFPENLSSNSSNFASMFSRTLGDTGSPFNSGVYLQPTTILSDPGTDGETTDVLLDPKKATAHALEEEAPDRVLEEILRNFFDQNPHCRALIDRGALLNGMGSKVVAQKLLAYIQNRADLDGVAFYLDRDLMIWEKGDEAPKPISQSRIPIDRRLSYYPQPQTYGADIPQIEEAIGVVTIGEDLCFHEYAQAVWRMRGLKRNQTLQLVYTKRVQKQISEYATGLNERAREKLIAPLLPQFRSAIRKAPLPKNPLLDILLFTLKNQGLALPEDNYQADIQKLYNVLRRAVMDKVLFAPNLNEALNYLQQRDLFISEVCTKPDFLFGLLDTYVAPKEIFSRIRKTLQEKIEQSALFNAAEKSRLIDELEAIGQGIYPEKVHSYQSSGTLDPTRLKDLNKESQVERAEDVEQEQELDLDLDLDMNQNNSLSIQTISRSPQVFTGWSDSINPTQMDWLTISPPPCEDKGKESMIQNTPPIYALKDALRTSSDAVLQNIATKVASNILASNNITYLSDPNDMPIQPFGPGQVPLLEALLIQQGGEKTQFLLIDQKEAHFWRKKLKEDREGLHQRNPNVRLALFDLKTRILVSEGFYPFPQKELDTLLFKRTLAQILFLRGDTSFDPDLYPFLKPWLNSLLSPLTEFAEYVAKYHSTQPYENSELESVLLRLKLKQQEKKPLRA